MREGVPTPMLILEKLGPRRLGVEGDQSELPGFLDVINCLAQLDMFGKEFCYYSSLGLKDA